MTANLAMRATATEMTLADTRDAPFAWDGENCIRLARRQAVNMGHDVPSVPNFKSVIGAARALKKQGASDLAELLDQWFDRHDAPAFALIGDLAILPGEDGGFDSICISDGRGNLFGWHDSDLSKMSVIKAADADIIAAWRL